MSDKAYFKTWFEKSVKMHKNTLKFYVVVTLSSKLFYLPRQNI